jgi:hypothetical protein
MIALTRRVTLFVALPVCLLLCPAGVSNTPAQEKAAGQSLEVGFGEADITPKLKGKPVYMAGFGQNRIAKSVNDPLMARAVVLKAGGRKVALASVDLVGLFREPVQRIRGQLPGFTYILVSSTHNHEGPDTMGLWGPHPFQSGIDPDYLKFVEAQVIRAVKQADAALAPVTARIGKATAPDLVRDTRQPIVKHDELVALSFQRVQDGKTAGLVVQWNCHPETLDSKNLAISADFVGFTVNYLRKRHQCPVVYLTGTVGGLMTTLGLPVKDEQGTPLKDGTLAKTKRYGELVGQLADQALAGAEKINLVPVEIKSREVFLPIDNKLYVFGWRAGVLQRKAFVWKGDPSRADLVPAGQKPDGRMCVQTEVALLRLGQLKIAAIPGEIYPELVLDKVENPAQPGADFPDAPIEPAIYKQMTGPHRMIVGLANDELGYILPKRQWDEKPPFCYGRTKAQYGEINSLGPETAPLLCGAFRDLAKKDQINSKSEAP